MKKLNSFKELAEVLNVYDYQVEMAYGYWSERGNDYFIVKGIEVHLEKDGDKNVIIPLVTIEDKKDYFIKYQQKDYVMKCYIDDIEKWQEVEIIDIYNFESEHERAVVRTKAGTQVVRKTDLIFDEEDINKTGNVYLIEKDL